MEAVLGDVGSKCWSWGHLGAFGTKNMQKDIKLKHFFAFLGRLGRRFGPHVGSKRPSWLHLGLLGLDFESLWGDLGGIFWSFCCMCCISENVKKTFSFHRFFDVLGVIVEVLGALFAPKCAVLGILGHTWGHLAPKT